MKPQICHECGQWEEPPWERATYWLRYLLYPGFRRKEKEQQAGIDRWRSLITRPWPVVGDEIHIPYIGSLTSEGAMVTKQERFLKERLVSEEPDDTLAQIG